MVKAVRVAVDVTVLIVVSVLVVFVVVTSVVVTGLAVTLFNILLALKTNKVKRDQEFVTLTLSNQLY